MRCVNLQGTNKGFLQLIKKLNICYAYANIIRFLKIRKALNRLLANSLICPPYTKEVTSKPR